MSRDHGGLAVVTWCGDGHAELHVDRAPPRVLLPLTALQTEHMWHVQGGRIRVGIDLTGRPATREPVWYQVTGWDNDHQALIIEREPREP